MKIRILAFVLSLCLLMGLTACGGGAKENETISLTDQCGRTVELDAPAQKVVSCYYVSSYAMMALGLSDRLVGIENKAASRPIYAMSAPHFLELPAVGTMKECNVELIASLEPDLVIMPKKLSEAADTLTGLGLTVMLVNPEDHESLQGMLTLIATACGVKENAQSLLNYYTEQMTKLEQLTAGAAKPTVYLGGNSSYLTVAPGAMYQSSLISLAGGTNVAAALEGNYWTEVSYEAILAYNPDVIVIPSGADYTVADICNDAQLSVLEAVKNGAVYAMPGSIEEWDSPIPSGILGAMWLASVLHSDKYTPDTFAKDAVGFYETFYGFTPDSALLK